MERYFALNWREKEKFPENYMDYIHTEILSNFPKPYTLSRNVSSFLRNYLNYIEHLEEYNPIFPVSLLINYLTENNIITLTKEQQEALPDFETFLQLETQLTYQGVEATIIEKQTKPYQYAQDIINQIFEDPSVTSFIQNTWKNIEEELIEIKEMENPVSRIEMIFQDTDLKEILITHQFYHYIDWKRASYKDSTMDYFLNKVSNTGLTQTIISLQDHYKNLEEQSNEYIESPTLTHQYNEIEEIEEVFKLLLKPYEGKVIYIDFWGTWCGPCKEYMKHTPPIKERFKDKDVIFMYFAYASPELPWKNVIKEYDLIGDNVVHYNLPNYQQEQLNRSLSLEYFPTYYLVNKNGNIVNTNAALPIDRENLINQIEELLNQ